MPDPTSNSKMELKALTLEASPRDPEAISSYYLWIRVMQEILDRIPAEETDSFRLTTLSRGLSNKNYMLIKDAADVPTDQSAISSKSKRHNFKK